MTEWLRDTFDADKALSLTVLLGRLLAAFALGVGVAFIHRFTARKNGQEPQSFAAMLVLLSILIAMVTQVVGDNAARAFSLVGALAIVRFRTVVEDTRDTAFVIFAVVVGMSCGAGALAVGLSGLAVGGAAAYVFRPRAAASREALDYTLTIRIGLRPGLDSAFESLFGRHLERAALQSTSTARQGAALELTWHVRLRPATNPLSFVGELNQVEGVQGVELQRR